MVRWMAQTLVRPKTSLSPSAAAGARAAVGFWSEVTNKQARINRPQATIVAASRLVMTAPPRYGMGFISRALFGLRVGQAVPDVEGRPARQAQSGSPLPQKALYF